MKKSFKVGGQRSWSTNIGSTAATTNASSSSTSSGDNNNDDINDSTAGPTTSTTTTTSSTAHLNATSVVIVDNDLIVIDNQSERSATAAGHLLPHIGSGIVSSDGDELLLGPHVLAIALSFALNVLVDFSRYELASAQ